MRITCQHPDCAAWIDLKSNYAPGGNSSIRMFDLRTIAHRIGWRYEFRVDEQTREAVGVDFCPEHRTKAE